MLDICLLGCGGSLPVPYRSLSSLLISYQGKKILIDCGEGTQVSMKLLGWGFKSIDVICFTHAHADHIMGLPGLLLTIANSNRTEPLTIIGPTSFKEIFNGLMVVCPNLPFEVNLIEASEPSCFLFDNLIINTLPVEHTVPCIGFNIVVNRNRKFNLNKAKENSVPMLLWGKLQRGESISQGGRIYTPAMVLGAERKGLKLSYTTDTRPIEALIDFVKDSDLLICEGMYGEDADKEKALKNKHMLYSEAANIAKHASVSELWLTHFSPGMRDPEMFLQNAIDIFEHTVIGKDRMLKTLDFKE